MDEAMGKLVTLGLLHYSPVEESSYNLGFTIKGF